MKTISSLTQTALLALALGTATATAAFAQTTTNAAPAVATAPAAPADTGKHRSDPALTSDERAQLKRDKAAALAANPALQTESDSLKQQHDALKAQGANAPKADKEALRAQMKDFETKLRAAMLVIDPTVAPVFAKQDAAHPGKPAGA